MNRLPTVGDIVLVGRKQLLVIEAKLDEIDGPGMLLGTVYWFKGVPISDTEMMKGGAIVDGKPVTIYTQITGEIKFTDGTVATPLSTIQLVGTAKFKPRTEYIVTNIKELQ